MINNLSGQYFCLIFPPTMQVQQKWGEREEGRWQVLLSLWVYLNQVPENGSRNFNATLTYFVCTVNNWKQHSCFLLMALFNQNWAGLATSPARTSDHQHYSSVYSSSGVGRTGDRNHGHPSRPYPTAGKLNKPLGKSRACSFWLVLHFKKVGSQLRMDFYRFLSITTNIFTLCFQCMVFF